MAMQGSSRPASGCEHHCSHFWDLLAFRGLLRHEPHGLQVGYATGFVTQLQASCLDGLALPLRLVPGSGDGDGANEAAWLGEKSSALGEGPSALGEKSSALGEGPSALAAVRDAKAADFAAYGPSWPPAGAPLGVLTAALDDAARLFAPVSAALQRAGIPDEPGFLGLDRIVLTATLRYANRLRNRFSVLDLLESQGRLDALIETLLAS
jgi:glycerol-1-phosphate dehydrogenase [NAD(P)+]